MKKSLAILLCAMMLFSSFAVMLVVSGEVKNEPVSPQYAGGDGSSGDPYQISTIDHLQSVKDDNTVNFILINDIDASETEFWNWNGNYYEGFIPIGNIFDIFQGSFDGDGYVIKNLHINRLDASRQGLFGYAQNAYIHNVSVVNAEMIVGNWAGIFLAYGSANRIENCSASGTISGNNYIGGFAGEFSGATQVRDCFSECEVSGNGYVGGFAGQLYAWGEALVNCYSVGSVTGNTDVGGFIGLGRDVNIINCYSTADVYGTFESAGFMGGELFNTANIYNSYSTGAVAGGGTINGFSVASGTISNCFWDTDTSGVGSSATGTGKTTLELTTANTYVTAGWDLVNTWYMEDDNTRPFLRSEHNYTIVSPHQLQLMTLDMAGTYRVGGPLDMSGTYDRKDMWATSLTTGKGFLPIGNGTTQFSGNLNGESNIVSNLYINRPTMDQVGLLGWTSGGQVRNLNMTDVDVTGNQYTAGMIGRSNSVIWDSSCTGTVVGGINTGLIAGQSWSNIFDCYASGTVNGGATNQVGVFVGTNSANVFRSYSTGSATGNTEVGGFCGRNMFQLTDCYSTADATSTTASVAGGLIGYAWGGTTIQNCFASGVVIGGVNLDGGLVGDGGVHTVTDCFWDTETSGTAFTDGAGTAITTAQAKQEATYTNWDFTNIWLIYEDETRPFLRNEISTQIRNSHQLQLMQEDITADYELVYDVDATDTMVRKEMWGSDMATGKGFIPIANDTNPAQTGAPAGSDFSGHFEGNGYTITGLFINRTTEEGVGLFGQHTDLIEPIGNVTLADVNITGLDYVGGLVGMCTWTDIINCHVTGRIFNEFARVGGMVGVAAQTDFIDCTVNVEVQNTIGTGHVTGGLVGNYNGGVIENCHSYGKVTGGPSGLYTGGLVGFFTGSSYVINCSSDCNVTGYEDRIGGLIGHMGGGEMWNSTSSNGVYAIVGAAEDVGGLAGRCEGSVYNCTSYAEVAGSNDLGGLFGEATAAARIYDSRAYGKAIGNQYVGGVIGKNLGGQFTDCLSLVNTSASLRMGGFVGFTNGGVFTRCTSWGNISSGGTYTGGFVGQDSTQGTYTDCTAYGDVTSSNDYVGGFAGSSDDGTTDNCTAYGEVNAQNFVGGFIGFTSGTVNNSRAYGDVTGTGTSIGGFAGYNYGNTYAAFISNSTAHGNSSTTDANRVGGFIGYNIDGTAYQCEAHGNATGIGTSDEIGGFAGYSQNGVFTNCNAYGEAMGQQYVAGLVGWSTTSITITNCNAHGNATAANTYAGGLVARLDDGGTVQDSQAYGNVSGVTYIGGIVGRNAADISNCQAFGNITATNEAVGGLVGYNLGSGYVDNCQAYNNVSGTRIVGGLVGQNVGQISNSSAYGNASGTNDDVGGLVGFNWDTAGGANVTNCTAYGNATGLEKVGGLIGYNQNGNVENCTSYGKATGTGGLYVGGLIGEHVGLVANCTAYGDAYSNNDMVGGLIGRSTGVGAIVMFSRAYGDAESTGGGRVGGFIGENGGPVSQSCSYGDAISGMWYGGGFIADNSGDVSSCYAHGDATSNNYGGGFIGNNAGTIDNCYSKGFVTCPTNDGGFMGFNGGTVNNCFWDNETSGRTASNGGTGRNTVDMMQQSTFTGAGWDFTTIWGIHKGNTYPFLRPLENPPAPQADLNITIDDSPDFLNVGDTLHYFVNITNYGTGNAVDVVATINLPGQTSYVTDNKSIGAVGQTITWNIGWLMDGEVEYLDITVTVNLAGSGTITCTGSVISSTLDPGVYGNYSENSTTVNRAPTASNDTNTIDEDNTLNVGAPGVLLNDNDLDLDSLTVTLYDNPSTYGATVTVNGDGSYTYDPTGSAALQALKVGESVIDTISYTVSDGNGETDTASLNITVTGVNDVPSANNDVATIDEDSGANTIYVLTNDNDIDASDPLSITVVTQGTHGTVAITGGGTGLTYEPEANYTGADSFTYTISDGNGGTDTATVAVTVNGVNDPPTISTTAVTQVIAGQSYSVDYNATDIDTGDTLTWSLSTNATWLSIDAATGELSGIPTNDDSGAYWVNVSVSDGNGGNDWTNFTLKVLRDTDGDGTPDKDDGDDDGDDVPDDQDDFPLDPDETEDTDGDGTGNNEDTDDDGDGVNDDEDDFPLDSSETVDTDGDGTGDNEDTDDDGDGVADVEDDFPLDATETTDTDGDGTGDNADTDDDGDGVPDTEDIDPLDPHKGKKGIGGVGNLWFVFVIIAIVAVLLLLYLLGGMGKTEVEMEDEEPDETGETEDAGEEGLSEDSEEAVEESAEGGQEEESSPPQEEEEIEGEEQTTETDELQEESEELKEEEE